MIAPCAYFGGRICSPYLRAISRQLSAGPAASRLHTVFERFRSLADARQRRLALAIRRIPSRTARRSRGCRGCVPGLVRARRRAPGCQHDCDQQYRFHDSPFLQRLETVLVSSSRQQEPSLFETGFLFELNTCDGCVQLVSNSKGIDWRCGLQRASRPRSACS